MSTTTGTWSLSSTETAEAENVAVTTFEIYFHGLICFWADEDRGASSGKKTHLIFVDDGGVHSRGVVVSPDNPLFDTFKTLTITAKGGKPGAITLVDPDGDIPSLGDDAISPPGYRAVTNQKSVTVKLPDVEGTIRVAERFERLGNFRRDGGDLKQHAVARLNVLEITAESIEISADGEPAVPLSTDEPWALILNSSDHVDPHDNHFQHYRLIMVDEKGKPAGAKVLAQVLDDDNNAAAKTNGKHVEKVKKLKELQTLAPMAPGGDAAANEGEGGLHLDKAVLTQTQCSNSQWP